MAETLAESAYIDLLARGKEVSVVGVKRSNSGTLYVDEEFDCRWVVKKRQ